LATKVSRAQWGARPPKKTPLGINTRSATGHWEGTHMGSFPHESCATKMRVIQNYHMDTQGWNDIAYNFAVCPHGYIYVARDHGIRSSANGTNTGNAESEAVCYLGGLGDPFTIAGEIAYQEIMNEISPGRQFCHNHWFNTMCPGPEICDEIKNGYQRLPDGYVEPPRPEEDEDVQNLTFCAAHGDGQQFVTDMGQWKRPLMSEDDWNVTLLCLTASGAKVFHQDINNPIRVPRETLDAIPTVKV
jgi:hypothetical protein